MSVEVQIGNLEAMINDLMGAVSNIQNDLAGTKEFGLRGMQKQIDELEQRAAQPSNPDNEEMIDPENPYYGEGDRLKFTGVAYVAGRKITGLNSTPAYPWVKCDASAGTAEEVAGPPSSPFPPNEEWHEKKYTYGDIHVTRL